MLACQCLDERRVKSLDAFMGCECMGDIGGFGHVGWNEFNGGLTGVYANVVWARMLLVRNGWDAPSALGESFGRMINGMRGVL